MKPLNDEMLTAINDARATFEKTVEQITGCKCNASCLISAGPTTHGKQVSAYCIIEAVCNEFNITMAQLTGKDRHRAFSDARAICTKLLREMGELQPTWKEIAEKLNFRDHAHAIWNANKANNLLPHDEAFTRHYQNILTRLKSI